MTWKLEAITGEFTGKEVSVERDMLIGRHQDADLLLQSADVSRRHAAFLVKEDALYVQDLKSSNGTFVNDARIEHETLLKDGDIVQFASHKFSVLAPAVDVTVEPVAPMVAEQEAPVVASTTPAVEENIQQPSEAIAASETAQAAPIDKTPAQQMNDQGMPDLKQRDASVQLSREGMPQNVGIPKPAPIPEGTDLSSVKLEPAPIPVEKPVSIVEQKVEEQKNATVGLMSLIALIIIAIIAWLIFK